jgi:hypothetical protein
MKLPLLLCSTLLLTSVVLTGCGNDDADKKPEAQTSAPAAEESQTAPAVTTDVDADTKTTAEAVEEKTETMVEEGKEMATDAAEAVGETATSMDEGASEMASDVASEASDMYKDTMGAEETMPAETEEKTAQ